MKYVYQPDRFDWPEYPVRVTRRRPMPSEGPQAFIIAHAELHYLKGNARPYFAVGGEIWERPKARDCVSCGCLHDDIARIFPNLAPIIALHLSDDKGVPMHAEANGWYTLAGYYGGLGERYHRGNSEPKVSPVRCLELWAEHVRIPIAEAKTIVDQWRIDAPIAHGHVYAAESHDWPAYLKRRHHAFILEQTDRWKAEAIAAIERLETLATETNGVAIA